LCFGIIESYNWGIIMVDNFQGVSGILILGGILILVLAFLWPFIEKLGLGSLPGDFTIERGNFRVYVPITTSIILSLLLMVIFWVLKVY